VLIQLEDSIKTFSHVLSKAQPLFVQPATFSLPLRVRRMFL